MRRHSRNIIKGILYGIILSFALIGIISTVLFLGTRTRDYVVRMKQPKVVKEAPEIDEQLLSPNEYSRPVLPTDGLKGIVVHYTANPGTTAQQNRDYFEGLKDSHLTKASSNYVIGLDGEIIRCIPDDEVAYASNERNHDTISIECCHFDETGEFYRQTYQSLVHLVA
ncbi:MAG: N-acetylmuramoyl-L-alanine amidase, partial [Lachnospiraceae bacterium]|nr:N-acetylmuramoyl-L-alanine amidase [Lachnospiraceae bacterium]